jgi:hypothetical protein
MMLRSFESSRKSESIGIFSKKIGNFSEGELGQQVFRSRGVGFERPTL